jgi:hypothetical protein
LEWITNCKDAVGKVIPIIVQGDELKYLGCKNGDEIGKIKVFFHKKCFNPEFRYFHKVSDTTPYCIET